MSTNTQVKTTGEDYWSRIRDEEKKRTELMMAVASKYPEIGLLVIILREEIARLEKRLDNAERSISNLED